MTNLHHLAGEAVKNALDRGLTVATAESLTAGMVSAILADTAGASGMLQGVSWPTRTPSKSTSWAFRRAACRRRIRGRGSCRCHGSRRPRRPGLGHWRGHDRCCRPGGARWQGRGDRIRRGRDGGRHRVLRLRLLRQPCRDPWPGLRSRPGASPGSPIFLKLPGVKYPGTNPGTH